MGQEEDKFCERISICGIADLDMLSHVRFDYVVSIIDPESPEPDALQTFSSHKRLTLRFHDVSEEIDNMVAPDRAHIEQLLTFGRSMCGSPKSRLLVHCLAGVSRSTAAAMLLIAQSAPQEPPKSAVSQVLELAPNAWPNFRMIRIGDEILQCDGQLKEAVQSHYSDMAERYPVFGRMISEARRA